MKESDYFYTAVLWAVEQGITAGTGPNTFGPELKVTREQIVVLLHSFVRNYLGQSADARADLSGYQDLSKTSAWARDAFAWAVAEGVADGYGEGLFGPNDAITREQLAAMLWRYAARPESEGGLSAFADGAEVSVWAQQAMSWAVSLGLINGVDSDRLDPKGQATRAQTATILMRFAQSMTR